MRRHTDYGSAVLPSYATVVHAIEVPSCNVTEFADMVAAFEAMPPREKESRRRRKVLYDKVRGQAAMARAKGNLLGAATEHVPTPYEEWRLKTCEHPLVRRIPESGGLEALFIGDATLSVTFPAGSDAEAATRGEAELERWRQGLRDDLEFATQPRFCYRHMW